MISNRFRHDHVMCEFSALAEGNRLRLTFPEGWLEQQPLLLAEFEREQAAWERVGHELLFS